MYLYYEISWKHKLINQMLRFISEIEIYISFFLWKWITLGENRCILGGIILIMIRWMSFSSSTVDTFYMS